VSTYSSDAGLDMFDGPYRIDVAACCFGTDVRLLVDHRSAYLTSDEARALAAALIRNAEWCEESHAVYGGTR